MTFVCRNFFVGFFSLFYMPCIANSVSLTYFNVGQGNCVVVKCPQRSSMLVDCGTSEHDKGFRDDQGKLPVDLDKIERSINEMALRKPITIIVTHLDKDHYNLLYRIFKDATKQQIEQIIIGGIWKEHQLTLDRDIPLKPRSPLSHFNLWLLDMQKKGVPITLLTSNEIGQAQTLPVCGEEKAKIMVSNAVGTSSSDKALLSNGNGAVVKVKLGKCSAILPGDATKETTEKIIEQELRKLMIGEEYDDIWRKFIELKPSSFDISYIQSILRKKSEESKSSERSRSSLRGTDVIRTPSPKALSGGGSPEMLAQKHILHDHKAGYKTTVMMASHHGADSHGSNNLKWIFATQPQVVVFSAGHYDRYNHPQKIVFDSFTNTRYSKFILDSVPSHPFSYFSPAFNTINTELGIFNTFDEGNIEVNFLKGRPSVTPSEDKTLEVMDTFSLKTERGSIIERTPCFSLSGIPMSPTRGALSTAKVTSPGHGLTPTPLTRPGRARRGLDFSSVQRKLG